MSEANEGRAKGGRARAEALSGERRSEIAKAAAEKRWSDASIAAGTHEGVLKIGDAELSCYVLENGERIISTRGIMKALGRTWRGRKYAGTQLPVFIEAKNLIPFIDSDLRLVLDPVEFRTPSGLIAEGFKATVLPSVCDVYLRARDAGALAPNQISLAKQCDILVRSFAKVGIIALVDEATGYQEIRPKDALQAYLEKVISAELAAWVKRFPDEFYENIYKLRGWTWPGMGKNRYSIVGTYTRDLVYERLGPGILDELEKKAPKKESGERAAKMHQWLTDDVGHPMLAQHLHSLIMFQRLAIASGFGWNRFVKMVDQVMPKRGSTLELPLDEEVKPA